MNINPLYIWVDLIKLLLLLLTNVVLQICNGYQKEKRKERSDDGWSTQYTASELYLPLWF